MRDILSDLEAAEQAHPDPMKSAQKSMAASLPKRFYKDVTVDETDAGFVTLLDGRTVKTPGRAVLALRHRVLADRLAAEFDSQKDVIDPATMPLYRLANTAIDGVAADMQSVAEDVIRFAGSDLLCYRAETPDGLVAAQSAQWDEPLDIMASRLGARFVLAEGVMHVTQPKAVLAPFGMLVAQFDHPLELAALHAATSLTGSAVLALCLGLGEMDAEAVWTAAHVDEDWNAAHWGEDAEAIAVRRKRRAEFDAASAVLACRVAGQG